MRGYLLRLFGIFFIVGVGELLLPDGNIKKYAKIVMSILIFNVLLSPVGVIPKFDINIDFEETMLSDTFDEQVRAEYIKNIQDTIKKESGAQCKVEINEDNTIKKVILYGEISENAKKYIGDELGVRENDIEIRKD